MAARFLLLMRHTARNKMLGQAFEIGRGLHDYMRETSAAGDLALRLGLCLHPMKGPAADSARALQAALAGEAVDLALATLPPVGQTDPLDPLGWIANPYYSRQRKQRRCQVKALSDVVETIKKQDPKGDNNAILVIGHSPQIDWLLHELVGSHRYQHAFGAGEIICVDLKYNRAIWSLAPTDRETVLLLREKIKGKMESAKLLGGIVAAGISFVLAGFHDLAFGSASTLDDLARVVRRPADSLEVSRVLAFGLSISTLLLATGLYCLAYLSYDRLLMPARFWAAAKPPKPVWHGVVWRPPSSSLLVMHQNMQRVWNRTFIPATLATGIALVLLAYATIIQRVADTLESSGIAQVWFAAAVAVLLLALLIFRWWARPIIGAQD
jgi:hypothetical protein